MDQVSSFYLDNRVFNVAIRFLLFILLYAYLKLYLNQGKPLRMQAASYQLLYSVLYSLGGRGRWGAALAPGRYEPSLYAIL